MMKGVACPHCKSPARGNPCWWLLDNPHLKGCGGDPPCACDEHEERQLKNERDVQRGLNIAVALVVALLLAFMCAAAFAHSWYDASCCSDNDCRPVPAEDVIETEKGWKHLPSGVEFTRDMVKPSKDRHFHVCIGNKAWDRGKPYCIYILQGA